MEYVIAVFSVRTQTIMFNNALQSNGIKSGIIDTPKQANLSCGISVKFLKRDFERVKRFLNRNFDSFKGFYEIKYLYNKIVVYPLK